ncbi:MAG: ABC transporter substrate-binding protein, partial [Clostridiales bacterium]|nr:ABC transporter substrate-binding protein [Clostridiales bacterium]
MKSTNFFKQLALLIFCILFLSACSSEPVMQIKASTNDRIVIATPQDFDSLDPHLSKSTDTQSILFNIFQGLVMPSQNGSIVPALAESWKISS